ncbi:MAG: amino acid permease [Catenulispora sp.]|nr:amino acid permease [Catenulispora sp.]
MTERAEGLGLAEGTAMYVGAVLGPGVMSLPALGVAAAGPASVVAWVGLLVLSVPVAVCFATLGGRFPGGGGISAFVQRAFGPGAAAATGWLFYAAVPVGVLAGALVGGQYVGEAAGFGIGGRYGVAALLLACAFAANYAGLRLSGRLQLILVAALAALLVVAVVVAAPQVRAERYEPFAPHGASGIGQAALVVYYAFTGWEAAVHLSAEFRNPRRHLLLATKLTLATVGVLYLSLVLTVIGVLGDDAGRSPAPLTALLRIGLGDAARPATAAVAVLLSLGALNTFVAGAARLGAALGRSGFAPRGLARGGGRGQVPQVSLTVQMVVTFAVTAVAVVLGLDLRTLMTLTSVMLGGVTVAGLLAGVRLLAGHRVLRAGAVVAVATNVVVLAFGGWMVVVPVVVACAAAGAVTSLSGGRRGTDASVRVH